MLCRDTGWHLPDHPKSCAHIARPGHQSVFLPASSTCAVRPLVRFFSLISSGIWRHSGGVFFWRGQSRGCKACLLLWLSGTYPWSWVSGPQTSASHSPQKASLTSPASHFVAHIWCRPRALLLCFQRPDQPLTHPSTHPFPTAKSPSSPPSTPYSSPVPPSPPLPLP